MTVYDNTWSSIENSIGWSYGHSPADKNTWWTTDLSSHESTCLIHWPLVSVPDTYNLESPGQVSTLREQLLDAFFDYSYGMSSPCHKIDSSSSLFPCEILLTNHSKLAFVSGLVLIALPWEQPYHPGAELCAGRHTVVSSMLYLYTAVWSGNCRSAFNMVEAFWQEVHT